MTIEVDETTLPSYWASALVNGDFSGLDDDEAQRCQAAIDRLAEEGWEIVDVVRDENGEGQEERFTNSYYLYDRHYNGDILVTGGSVLDYVLHRRAR